MTPTPTRRDERTTNTPTLTTTRITNQTESTTPNTPTTQTDNPPHTHLGLKKKNIQQHQLHHQHRHTPDTVTQQQISVNSTQIHTSIVQSHLMQRNHNKLIHQHAPKISPSELSPPRETRRTLAQLRTNKSPHPYIIPTQSRRNTPPLPSLSPLQNTPT